MKNSVIEKIRPLLLGASMAALAGCTVTSVEFPQEFVDRGVIAEPTPDNFTVCFGHGCKQSQVVDLTEEEWASVRAIFADRSVTAEGERELMRDAIAHMEQMVGPKSGTDGDIGGSFKGSGRYRQQDCVDEMLNTAIYLTMMINDGLIQHHTIDLRVSNGFFEVSGWPHTATSIKDQTTGVLWVIDSWWLDNGKKPYVVLLEEWKTGSWKSRLLPEGA